MKEQRAVPPALANLALDALVRQLFDTSWGKARGWIESGKVAVDGRVVRELRAAVAPGATLTLNMNAPRSAPAPAVADGGSSSLLDRNRLVHVDTQIVVVDKPPGISSVPYDAREKNTLIDQVGALLGRGRLEVVHRLDKETSGLIVFARTRETAQGLANQFRFHTIHRRYLALAHGRFESTTLRSILVADRGDGLRGSAPSGWRVAQGEGQEAVTHVRALEALRGATLVECRLETGRTHQIRIHLSEAGHPLLGERVYVREFRGPAIAAPRVMLHAAELGLRHPVSGAELTWGREAPRDFADCLAGLRK